MLDVDPLLIVAEVTSLIEAVLEEYTDAPDVLVEVSLYRDVTEDAFVRNSEDTTGEGELMDEGVIEADIADMEDPASTVEIPEGEDEGVVKAVPKEEDASDETDVYAEEVLVIEEDIAVADEGLIDGATGDVVDNSDIATGEDLIIEEGTDVTVEADVVDEDDPAEEKLKAVIDCAEEADEKDEADPAGATVEDEIDAPMVDDEALEVMLHAAGSVSALTLCQLPLWSVQL